MITREYLDARLQEFIAARDQCQADLNANNGAIQVCRHLLNTLAAEAEADAAQGDTHETAPEHEGKANGVAPTP